MLCNWNKINSYRLVEIYLYRVFEKKTSVIHAHVKAIEFCPILVFFATVWIPTGIHAGHMLLRFGWFVSPPAMLR